MKPFNKLTAVLLPLLWLQTDMQGQCTQAQAYFDVDISRLRARIMQGGNLFTDYSSGQFFPKNSEGSLQAPIIAKAGFWMGGADPAGNLTMASATGRPDGVTDFWPGPLDQNGQCDEESCTNWDKIFVVKMADIQSYLAERHLYKDHPELAIAKYPTIFGWPGYGNPFFAGIHGFPLPNYGSEFYNHQLAEFYDANGNGLYNPLDGDFPEVDTKETLCSLRPSIIAWCVFNDVGAGQTHAISGGRAMHMEIKLSAFAYDCAEDPVLSQAIFTHYKFINKNPHEILDTLYAGIWVDPRLGCPYDDFLGYRADFNKAFYLYNRSLVDDPEGLCDQGQGLDETPPMLSVSFGEDMDHLLYMNNPEVNNPPQGTTLPESPAEYYNYLTGSWRDGSRITYGQMGYQTEKQAVNLVFPDNPKDSTGWSMCHVDVPYGERKIIASKMIGRMTSWQRDEITFIWMCHTPPLEACNLTKAYKESFHLRQFYFSDDHSNDCFSPSLWSSSPEFKLDISPNPARDAIRIIYPGVLMQKIELYNLEQKQVLELFPPGRDSELIDVSTLQPGVYFLHCIGIQGTAIKKIVVF